MALITEQYVVVVVSLLISRYCWSMRINEQPAHPDVLTRTFVSGRLKPE